MKTIYSIGRDPGCDIYLFDEQNLISRTHAILKVGKGGKYFILDQSMNGTYINGIKITPGVQVPVTRKDVITFAHVADLDWDQVPKSGSSALKISIISVVVLLLLGAAGYFGYEFMYKKGPANIVNPALPNIETPVQKDTVAKDTVKKEEVVAPKPKKKPVAKPKPVVKEEAPVEVKDTTEYQPFV